MQYFVSTPTLFGGAQRFRSMRAKPREGLDLTGLKLFLNENPNLLHDVIPKIALLALSLPEVVKEVSCFPTHAIT